MEDKKDSVKSARPILALGNTPTMRIPHKIISQIQFLHREIGKCEWSGILMLKMNGTLSDLNKLSCDVVGIFPCNIGTPASTSYDNSEHIFEAWDVFPEFNAADPSLASSRWDGKNCIKGTKMGQIHTHHSLGGGAYFSGVDIADLDTNSRHHGLYISLIVAMDGVFKAKGGFVCEVETTNNVSITPLDFDNPLVMKSTKKVEHLVTFDFEIEYQEEKWWLDRLITLEAMAKAEEEAFKARTEALKIQYKDIKPTNSKQHHNHPANKHNHRDILADAGVAHHYIPALGNVYVDGAGLMYSESGEKLTDFQEITVKKWCKANNVPLSI